jgi:hypothetical protein
VPVEWPGIREGALVAAAYAAFFWACAWARFANRDIP